MDNQAEFSFDEEMASLFKNPRRALVCRRGNLIRNNEIHKKGITIPQIENFSRYAENK